MPTVRELLRNLRLLISPRAVERDLEDELRAHLEMQTQANVARGMDPIGARASAERDFGPITSVKDELRTVHARPTAPLHESLGGDLRFAIRSLARHRVFSGVTVLVLTLGIAATTMMFSVVSGVLLRPLPFVHPEQVVMIWGSYPGVDLGFSEQPISGGQVKTERENKRAFETISAFVPRLFNLGSSASPARRSPRSSSRRSACGPHSGVRSRAPKRRPAPITSSSSAGRSGSAASAATRTRSGRRSR
jgi:hypothetical protein